MPRFVDGRRDADLKQLMEKSLVDSDQEVAQIMVRRIVFIVENNL